MYTKIFFQYLASGGNDNKLFVWSGAGGGQTTPMQVNFTLELSNFV